MSKNYRTLVTGNVPLDWTGKLGEISEIIIWPGEKDFLMPRAKVLHGLKGVHAIVNYAELRVDSELLDSAPDLRIVANASIGFDNLDLAELSRRGIWASNSPGFFNFAVAEYIIAGMLHISRRLGEAGRFVRDGNWTSFEPGRWDGISLREQSLGIIGMGAIGKELSAMAACIGMKVRYYDAKIKTLPGFMDLDELLNTSDFVSINVPLTKETHRMVDSEFMEKLKKGAVLINTSRGPVVDQAVLIDHLVSGRLRGAVLDVFDNEPTVPDELKQLYNVVITPHIAGGTKSSRKMSLQNVFLNVYQVLSGFPPLNPLNNIE